MGTRRVWKVLKGLLSIALISMILVFLTAGKAFAGPIIWSYHGVFSDLTGGADPLGVDGESFEIALVFSSLSTWEDNLFLSLEPISASASITGGNTIAHKTDPVVKHRPGVFVGFFEDANGVNYWDFVINGTPTITLNDNLLAQSEEVPEEGNRLKLAHLPTNPSGIFERVASTSFEHLYKVTSARIEAHVSSPNVSSLLLTAAFSLFAARNITIRSSRSRS